MTEMWNASTLLMPKRNGKALFESTGNMQGRLHGNRNMVLNPQDKQRGLWTQNTKESHENNQMPLLRDNVSTKDQVWYPGPGHYQDPSPKERIKKLQTELALYPLAEREYGTLDPVVPEVSSPPIACDDYKGEPEEHAETCSSPGIMVQITQEKTPTLDFHDSLHDISTRETVIDPENASYVDSVRELGTHPEEIYMESAASAGGNPFNIFRLKHARSPVKICDLELQRLKKGILIGVHSSEQLESWFRESISVTNAAMMQIILHFLCDIIRSDVRYRAQCVRMMEIALLYHPDELVQSFTCEHLVPLFQPEVDDDIGGSFIRLFLSYKATFAAPGILVGGAPICVDSKGNFIYNMDYCIRTYFSTKYKRGDHARTNTDPEGYESSSLDFSANEHMGDKPSQDELPDFIGCGRIESMMMLKICAERAGNVSAFEVPGSRLRDWLCTIWFELEITRPYLPLIKMCIHWIDSREDPFYLKDAAFALLQKQRDTLGEFEGGRLLLLELLSYMLQRNGKVNVELSKIIDMISEGEENVFYAIIDSIIVHYFDEGSMLDLWCLLCILPWPVTSTSSAICRLMSCTFIVYYKLAYDSLNGKHVMRFESNPMGILENALRMCVCRVASPILAKSALLQTILLVESSPLPALEMSAAPLILSSLCPFLWKCHFVWSHCGRDIDPDNLIALRHLYNTLRRCVFCAPLSEEGCDLGVRSVPMFPRVHSGPDSQQFADVAQFIPKLQHAEEFVAISEVYTEPLQEPVMVKPTRKLDPPRGLRNLGNTCYYNSVIQALFHTRHFVQELLDMPTKKGAVDVYKKLFRKMLKRGKKPLDPGVGYKLLPSSWRRSAEQQDATEAFRHIMDSIDDTMGLWKRVFAGMIFRRIKCSHCGNVSDNSEVVTDFTFPLLGLPSIQDMFDDYCKIETLSGGNTYLCSKCNTHRTAYMWNVIASPPSHLLVILNRQVWQADAKDTRESNRARKQLEHVRIDSNLRVCQFDYSLYGAIIHSGKSTTSGHYYFVGRDSELLSDWTVCDDSEIRPATSSTINDISEDSKNSHVPYLVFYRCEQAPPTPL